MFLGQIEYEWKTTRVIEHRERKGRGYAYVYVEMESDKDEVYNAIIFRTSSAKDQQYVEILYELD